ncbi:unnamed protein product, partial [Allacma fusca]
TAYVSWCPRSASIITPSHPKVRISFFYSVIMELVKLINSEEKITQTNCEALLSEFFENNETISLGNRTIPEIINYIDRTITPDYLGVVLFQEKLIELRQLNELRAKPTDHDKSTYLYIDLLNKKVETKEQYLSLFNALFKSGNENIASRLFKSLKSFQPSPSDSVSTTIKPACKNTGTTKWPKYTCRVAVTSPEPTPASLLPEKSRAKDVQFTTASSAITKTTVHPQQSNEPAREGQLHNSQPRGQSNVTSFPSTEPLLVKNETGQHSPKSVSSSPGIYNQQSGAASLPKNEIALTIGSPKDMPPLPSGAKGRSHHSKSDIFCLQ